MEENADFTKTSRFRNSLQCCICNRQVALSVHLFLEMLTTDNIKKRNYCKVERGWKTRCLKKNFSGILFLYGDSIL